MDDSRVNYDRILMYIFEWFITIRRISYSKSLNSILVVHDTNRIVVVVRIRVSRIDANPDPIGFDIQYIYKKVYVVLDQICHHTKSKYVLCSQESPKS
jgi:hypothetical protein